MEETLRRFPFQKFIHSKYLTLEVMMYVDHPEVYKFMFKVNKQGRAFILNNIITIQNGFNNAGLITYDWYYTFGGLVKVE